MRRRSLYMRKHINADSQRVRCFLRGALFFMRIDVQCDTTQDFVYWNFYRPTILYICDNIIANGSFIDGFFVCHIVSSKRTSVVLIFFFGNLFGTSSSHAAVADSVTIQKCLWEPSLYTKLNDICLCAGFKDS